MWAAFVTYLALFFGAEHGYNAGSEDHGDEGSGEKKVMHVFVSLLTIGSNGSPMNKDSQRLTNR